MCRPWVSSFGGFKYINEMPLDAKLRQGLTKLPNEKERLLLDIRKQARCRGGCFDVFVWRHNEILFCEAKRSGHDRLRETQRKWIEAALACGIPLHSLLVVEWDFADAEDALD
ncbi:MAG: VRR-NUC domain-containing protein [Pseudolabrys sp.]